MTNKLLTSILVIGITLQLSGCTSGSKEGGQDASAQNDSQFAQEGEGDFAQQGGESPQNEIASDGTEKVADANAPQDAGQDLSLDGQQAKSGAQKDELSLDDPQPLPENVAGAGDPNKQQPPLDAALPPDQANANPTPPTDEALFKSEAPKPDEPAGDVAAAAAAPKAFAPLAKVKEAAFNKAGANLNRVYVARAGDKSLKAISQKIYGEDRSKDLKAWNPSVSAASVKIGNKIYYQSSTSPDDTKMMTFYEEQGIQPKVYMTQEGDNLRKLSKSWLGSGESWKEVWATNMELSPEQKGALPAGIQVKYWPEDLVAGLKAGEAGGDKLGAVQALPPDLNQPPAVAVNEVPPPPMPPSQPMVASTPESQTGGVGQMAPPPPPDQQAPPPPPPPPDRPADPKPIVKKKSAEAIDTNDPDTMMMMGLGGILIMAAAVLFVVLRKNRAKRIDLSQTQV